MPPRARKTTTAKASKKLPAEGVADALDVIHAPDEVIPPVVDEDDNPIPRELRFVTPDTDEPADEPVEDDVVEFTVDGQRLIAVRPDREAWGLLIAMLAKSATMADRAHSLQTFAAHVLDEPSYLYLQTRMLTRGDNFGIEMLAQIIDKLIQIWTPEQTPSNRADRRARARAMSR